MHMYKKSPLKLSRLVRYLADSNRRPRFCRPIPNHSGKVPCCGCKDTSFWRTTIYFQRKISNQAPCRQLQPVPSYQGYEEYTAVYIEEFQVFTAQMGHSIGCHNQNQRYGWFMESLRIGGECEHDYGQIRKFVSTYEAEIAPFPLSYGDYYGQHGKESQKVLDVSAAMDQFVVVWRYIHHRRQRKDKRTGKQILAF